MVDQKPLRSCFLLMLCLSWPLAAANRVMTVQVKQTQLRATPDVFGKSVKTLYGGDQVEILAEQKGWNEVRVLEGQETGWLHMSALQAKKLVFKQGAATPRDASGGDESLGTYGLSSSSRSVAAVSPDADKFNPLVEQEYRVSHPGLNYQPVDQLERNSITPDRLRAFLDEGELAPAAGGAR